MNKETPRHIKDKHKPAISIARVPWAICFMIWSKTKEQRLYSTLDFFCHKSVMLDYKTKKIINNNKCQFLFPQIVTLLWVNTASVSQKYTIEAINCSTLFRRISESIARTLFTKYSIVVLKQTACQQYDNFILTRSVCGRYFNSFVTGNTPVCN